MYVSGIMDDDGFYEGEHMASGKQGLVPSNYLKDPTADDSTSTAAAAASSATLSRNPSLRERERERERDPSAARQSRPSSANPQHRQTTQAEVHGNSTKDLVARVSRVNNNL